MPTLQELEGRYAAKLKEVNELPEKKPDLDWTADELTTFQQGQKELGDLMQQIVPLRAARDAASQYATEMKQYNTPLRTVGHGDGIGNVNGSESKTYEQPRDQQQQSDSRGRTASQKSIGQAFVESASYKDYASDTRRQGMRAGTEIPELGFKATFTTSGSTLTQYDRQAGMVMVGTERLTVADLLAQGQTNQNTIRYVKEDTFTNAATTVAEGGTKPEASFDTSEVDAPVRKIAVVARVTDELFADFPAMRDYIDNRMRYMVGLTEETQLLSGDGNAPNLTGILNTAGIQTQAKGADPVPDAIYKAITKVRTVGFFEPDGVVIHPNDWTDVRLLRTADGLYIWGSPLEMGPERIWGLPVVVTTAMTENTALVGAFRLGAQIFRREGIRVEATNSNEDDFKKNLIMIRAEERLALAVYRPKAFATVTGI